MTKVNRKNVKLKKRERVNPQHMVDRNYEIAKMYKDWVPVREIGEKYNMTRSRVYEILERFVEK